MKKLILITLASILCSCSLSNTTQVLSKVEKSDAVIVNVADKGAEFSLNIGFKSNNQFGVKANTNGKVAKTSANIDKYVVYLVKNAALQSYPVGGDPIADKIAGPVTVTNSGAATKLVTFSNVPSSGGQAYYAAVRAMDTSNVELIKVNNGSATAWGTTTAAVTLKLAVSSGAGIIVDNNLQVSTPTAMTVTPILDDAIGAILEANISPTDGSSTLPAVIIN